MAFSLWAQRQFARSNGTGTSYSVLTEGTLFPEEDNEEASSVGINGIGDLYPVGGGGDLQGMDELALPKMSLPR